jgi:hypothetical protein
MTKPLITIHNLETNEIIEREMNDLEYAKHQADIALQEKEKAEAEAKATQKAALLDRLGITEEEAKLLLA